MKNQIQKTTINKNEKNDALILFGKDLVNTLAMGINNKENNEILDMYNALLLSLITDDENFKSSIEAALYSNEQKITHKTFELDGAKKRPTIGNWLKHFIKKQGSGLFNNVQLSGFMTNSENAKRLDKNEKKIIQKLLLLYRNIKFFPESQANIPPEEWEIFPIDKLEKLTKARSVSGPPKTESERRIEKIEKEEESYPEGSLERRAIEEEIEDEKETEDLKFMLSKYPEGSLERRAIEEEIKKLNSEE